MVKSMPYVDLAYLHPLTNVPTKYQLPTPCGFVRYGSAHILKVKVTTARSKVKSSLHHNIVYLHPLTNALNMYQLVTAYDD